MQILSGDHWKIHVGDVLDGLGLIPDKSVHCVVTSPPYWGLRDYGFEGQIGSEKTPEEFVETMVKVFSEVRRALRDDGTLFINLGDTYSVSGGARKYGSTDGAVGRAESPERQRVAPVGIPAGNQIGMPWRVAFALQGNGWILRKDIIWLKPSPMPESVAGWRWKNGAIHKGAWRPTTSHEMIFMFVKSPKYFCDGDGSKEPCSGTAHPRGSGVNPKALGGTAGVERQNGSFSAAVNRIVETRNMRSVWKIASESYKGAHFATYPTELVRRCLLPATSRGGCCSECGAQFAPVVDSCRVPTRPGTNTKVPGRNSRFFQERDPNHSGEYKACRFSEIVGNRDPLRHTTTTVVSDYLPTCQCKAAAGRPVVLDPFGGSCTTGQVAVNLGCDFIGCEANPEYAELGVKRIKTPWVPVGERKNPKGKRRKKTLGQKDLF